RVGRGRAADRADRRARRPLRPHRCAHRARLHADRGIRVRLGAAARAARPGGSARPLADRPALSGGPSHRARLRAARTRPTIAGGEPFTKGPSMDIGFVGLGRMGLNMTIRLQRGGHRVAAWDRSSGPIAEARANGATGVASLEGLVDALAAPRAIWAM